MRKPQYEGKRTKKALLAQGNSAVIFLPWLMIKSYPRV